MSMAGVDSTLPSDDYDENLDRSGETDALDDSCIHEDEIAGVINADSGNASGQVAPFNAESQGVAKTPGKNPTSKKNHEKKWRWKKPKGRPKRPKSAYNLFFQEQRQNLRHPSNMESDEANNMGFAGLAKYVAAKWKNMDPKDREPYEKQAVIEKQQYYVLLEQWKKENEGKAEARAFASLGGGAGPVTASIDVATLLSQANNNTNLAGLNNAAAAYQQNNLILQRLLSQQQAIAAVANGDPFAIMAAMNMPASNNLIAQASQTVPPVDMQSLQSGGRSMSMPMGFLPDAQVQISRRSMSMPFVSQPQNDGVSMDVKDATSEDSEVSTAASSVPPPDEIHPSRRMSMPVNVGSTQSVTAQSVTVSRRSMSMPMVNRDYSESEEQDQNSGDMSSEPRPVQDQQEWRPSPLDDLPEHSPLPDSHMSRRMSMPMEIANSGRTVSVKVTRRSMSMPMVTTDAAPPNPMSQHPDRPTSNDTHQNQEDFDGMMVDEGDQSSETNWNAEQGDGNDQEAIVSRRLSMPSAYTNQASVTISRRSMSMPLVTGENNHASASTNSGGNEDIEMDAYYNDILSQLRQS